MGKRRIKVEEYLEWLVDLAAASAVEGVRRTVVYSERRQVDRVRATA